MNKNTPTQYYEYGFFLDDPDSPHNQGIKYAYGGAEMMLKYGLDKGHPASKASALDLINMRDADADPGQPIFGPWAAKKLVAALPEALLDTYMAAQGKHALVGVPLTAGWPYEVVLKALDVPGITIHKFQKPISPDQFDALHKQFDAVHTSIFGTPYPGWDPYKFMLLNTGCVEIIEADFDQDGTAYAMAAIASACYNPANPPDTSEGLWLPGQQSAWPAGEIPKGGYKLSGQFEDYYQ